MAKLKEDLWKTLQDLKEDDFETFKWFLKEDGVLEGFSGIPVAQLEKAKRQDTVDLMIQKYQDHGAKSLTIKVLENIDRNDLVQRVQSFSLGPKRGAQKEEYTQKIQTPKLKWAKQFAVDVTLDQDTAHPNLILSDDGKQVHHGDVRKKLPNNPNRFYRCVNVLGKQGFTSGRSYYEVQVKGKTAWALGVAKESIKRNGNITANPEHGYWTIMLTNEDDYEANANDVVPLYLNHKPQKLGVYVGYEEGLVSFYDIDTAAHIYSFTGCSFTEELYPFFTPFTNDGGKNSAPLIISPVSHLLNLKMPDQIEEHKRKKAELRRVQQFAMDVTLDPDTAHPNLILSDDGKQVHHGDVRKTLPDNPERFYRCVNVLGKQSFSSGRFYFEVQVKGKTAWTLGVAKESIERNGDVTLAPKYGFWTVHLENVDDYQAIDNPLVDLPLKSHLQKVGVFVDYEEGLVSFYDVNAADLLYSFTGCSFTEKIYPFFSPCTNVNGRNSAPLIISRVLKTPYFGDQKEESERKKAELMRIQQFAVEVTLDPDTAHPALNLSDDRKQVNCGDVYQEVPDNPKRFKKCVNILGKQSLSSGRFYYEVQVKGKTAWTVGVATESINRAKRITLCPDHGFWTMWLRNEDEYEAIDAPSVHLFLDQHLQKVGVFVDYEEGLVSFYDVDAADLLYSFTDCTFTEKIYPFFSPCTNDGGINSTPLIISPVIRPHDCGGQKEEQEIMKAKLMSIQHFAVDVTLDPDTAHPNLILSDDGKQVHHGDVRKTLPDNPERFYRCVNVLGKQSFSSRKFYFEVQVKGKTNWTLGVAKESIERKGEVTLSPKKGFWTMWLRNEERYMANDSPAVRLSLKSNPQKVGVFVDYEEGLVSFYDVDAADLLYSFTDCSFTEKLLPYFSPCTNDNGRNSLPLIICPVNHQD